MIWTGDLVFDPRRSSFKLDLEINMTNTLSKIHDVCFKTVTSRVLTRFSIDLAEWPSLWPQVTKFWIWPRKKSSRKTFWARFMMTASKIWLLECLQGFPLIWPSDPVFDPKWSCSELDLEIIKTNILSKIHDDWFKNVTSVVLTRFSFDLALWPSFWHQVAQFQTWPRKNQDKHFEQYSWWSLQKCHLWSVNKVFLGFGLVT